MTKLERTKRGNGNGGRIRGSRSHESLLSTNHAVMSTIGKTKAIKLVTGIMLKMFILSLQTCQLLVQLALRPFIRQCLDAVIVFRFAVDLEANDIIAVVHVRSVTCGSTACASQFYPMLRTPDEQTIHSRCRSTRERRCHQRKSISARFASTRRFTGEHR